MEPRVGALILFAGDLERTVAFYRLLGLDLQIDEHDGDDVPLHYACEIGRTHFAIFPAAEKGVALPWRAAGSTFPGIVVDSVEAVVAEVGAAGGLIRQEPEPYPWGIRAILEDPDGRAVEVFRPPDPGGTATGLPTSPNGTT